MGNETINQKGKHKKITDIVVLIISVLIITSIFYPRVLSYISAVRTVHQFEKDYSVNVKDWNKGGSGVGTYSLNFWGPNEVDPYPIFINATLSDGNSITISNSCYYNSLFSSFVAKSFGKRYNRSDIKSNYINVTYYDDIENYLINKTNEIAEQFLPIDKSKTYVYKDQNESVYLVTSDSIGTKYINNDSLKINDYLTSTDDVYFNYRVTVYISGDINVEDAKRYYQALAENFRFDSSETYNLEFNIMQIDEQAHTSCYSRSGRKFSYYKLHEINFDIYDF